MPGAKRVLVQVGKSLIPSSGQTMTKYFPPVLRWPPEDVRAAQ